MIVACYVTCSLPEVGAILDFKYEKLDKKAQLQVFIDKVFDYVYSNIKHGGDLLPIFRDLVDPKKAFDKKRKPVKLAEDVEGDKV